MIPAWDATELERSAVAAEAASEATEATECSMAADPALCTAAMVMDAKEKSAAHAAPKQPDAKSDKREQQWSKMMQYGLRSYIRSHPNTFRRRVRRGIPDEHRWYVWKAVVQTEKRRQPGLYADLLQKQNPWTRAIDIDIARTFPENKAFDEEQQQRLLRLLNAYANFNPDVGYCQGMNFIAGLILLVSMQNGNNSETQAVGDEVEEEAFWMFVCLMEERHLNGFYKSHFPLLQRYLHAFDLLIATKLPELQAHFRQEGVQPAVYLHQWFLTLFINCLPLPMVLVFWDVIICEGLDCVLPMTVALLQSLQATLLTLGFEDIVRFFKMMRSGGADCNMLLLGTMVVSNSGSIYIPPHIAQLLQASETALPLEFSDDHGVAETAACDQKVAESNNEQSAWTGASSMLGAYLPGLSDIRLPSSQGVFSWWEDARDNLQRVGFVYPGVPRGQAEQASTGEDSAWSIIGAQGRNLMFQRPQAASCPDD